MELHQHLWEQLCTLTDYREESPVPKCLLALSGGADSMALLYAALPLVREGKITLACAHVHHGIRAQEADRDAAFCRLTCQRERIPFHLCHVDAPRLAKEKKQSLEEAARHARYACFDSLCQAHGYDWVLTAHHADDQIETVLLRLLRGASPKGLCGIPPRRGHYLRPFLSLPRTAVLAFCEEQEIAYVEDSTNADLRIARNYLRKQVIPKLKQLQPRLCETVARTTAQLREEQACLDDYLQLLSPTDAIADLQRLSPPMLRRYLARRYFEMGGEALTQTHLQALLSLVQSGKTGQSVCLPNGMRARIRYGRLCFAVAPPTFDFAPFPLKQGWNPLPDGAAIYCTDHEKEAKEIPNVYKFETSAILNSATIIEALVCRPRQNGDTMQMGGMTRKLKNLFQAAQLDAHARARLPLVCDGQGVLYIPFVGTCDRVQAKEGDARTYLFYTESAPQDALK